MTAWIRRNSDLALPIGLSLVVSTVALLLFPGLMTVVCQFLAGLLLIGIFALRKLLRYAKERHARGAHTSMISRRTVERGDVLLLVGFAGLYAGSSGFLMRAGWPPEAVRSSGFLLLLSLLLLRPRIAPRFQSSTKDSAPVTRQELNANSAVSAESLDFEIANQERIQ